MGNKLTKSGQLDKRYRTNKAKLEAQDLRHMWYVFLVVAVMFAGMPLQKSAEATEFVSGYSKNQPTETDIYIWRLEERGNTIREESMFIDGELVNIVHVNEPRTKGGVESAEVSGVPHVTHPIQGRDIDNPQYLQEVKDYMRHKFGNNYKTACMVAYGESLGNRWGINSSPVEYSVSSWQVNLADNHGHGRKVHWDKIPGDTLQEKTDWLRHPVNSTDFVYDLTGGGNNFSMFGAWLNQSYLRHESKCL